MSESDQIHIRNAIKQGLSTNTGRVEPPSTCAAVARHGKSFTVFEWVNHAKPASLWRSIDFTRGRTQHTVAFKVESPATTLDEFRDAVEKAIS